MLKSIDKSLNDVHGLTRKMNKKASINLCHTLAQKLGEKTNLAITIPKFNFNSNQIKIIVKGEHVEHTIYLF